MLSLGRSSQRCRLACIATHYQRGTSPIVVKAIMWTKLVARFVAAMSSNLPGAVGAKFHWLWRRRIFYRRADYLLRGAGSGLGKGTDRRTILDVKVRS